MVRQFPYFTDVRPILEYTCTISDPHTQIPIKRLEAIQNRAAHFVTGKYSIPSSITDIKRSLYRNEPTACQKHFRVTFLEMFCWFDQSSIKINICSRQLVKTQWPPLQDKILSHAQLHTSNLFPCTITVEFAAHWHCAGSIGNTFSDLLCNLWIAV